MNLFSSFTLTTLFLLTMPIMMTSSNTYKTSNYPLYVKTTISCAFITSMIPTMMFTHTGQEMIISNWHWLTIQTLKLSLSFKTDFFSMMFVPVALLHDLLESSQYDMYTQTPTLTNSLNTYSYSSSPYLSLLPQTTYFNYSLAEKASELYHSCSSDDDTDKQMQTQQPYKQSCMTTLVTSDLF